MKSWGFTIVLTLSLSTAALADDAPADIWKAKCQGCHGESGNGDTKVGRKEKIDDLSTERFQKNHTDEQIRKVITEGSEDNPKMKPFKEKLSAAEIDGLVKHIRGFKSAK